MDLQLSGKVALVTGSHRGTGAAIAETLAREGADVLVHGPTLAEAEPVAATIGGSAKAIGGDILTEDGAADMADRLADGGHIDILVANYGTAGRGSWSDMTDADWFDAYSHNVLSAVRLSRRLMTPMRAAGWGRIIHLGTVGSTRPNAAMPHYYAAKGALATLNVSLAKELAGTGVTVNLVSPGLIRTQEVEAHYRRQAAKRGWGEAWEDIDQAIAREIMPNLVGRIARTEEVADLVAYLASPRADFLTGQNFHVDGGALGIVS